MCIFIYIYIYFLYIYIFIYIYILCLYIHFCVSIDEVIHNNDYSFILQTTYV